MRHSRSIIDPRTIRAADSPLPPPTSPTPAPNPCPYLIPPLPRLLLIHRRGDADRFSSAMETFAFPSRDLARIFEPYPRLHLGRADAALFREFRAGEPGLVSLLDEAPETGRFETLVFAHNDHPLGVLSYLIVDNPRRADRRANRYARIDLVIVKKGVRGLGVSRVLILASLVKLLAESGERLYSISCLAAHPAIAAVLESLGFDPSPREDKGFTHEELRLEAVDRTELASRFTEQLAASLRRAHYRLRQR